MENIKVVVSEECITQHKQLVCDFKVRTVNDTRKKFICRREIWKLHDDYMISGRTSTSTEQVVKNIRLLKIIGRL